MTFETITIRFKYNLGTFDGFNFRDNAPIKSRLTAKEVVTWDHDAQGKAVFWPSGDHAPVYHFFKTQRTVSSSDLADLQRILLEFYDDSFYSFARIYYAVRIRGTNLSELTGAALQRIEFDFYTGESLDEARKEAAFALFERYYRPEYRAWEKKRLPSLIFHPDVFLSSGIWEMHEIDFGSVQALLIVICPERLPPAEKHRLLRD